VEGNLLLKAIAQALAREVSLSASDPCRDPDRLSKANRGHQIRDTVRCSRPVTAHRYVLDVIDL
jgi:hypothetical protein